MKDILLFNDKTTIDLESGSVLDDIKILSATKQDMLAVWDKFTDFNLKSVQIKNTDGVPVGHYENLVLENETSVIRSDGSILTSFRHREKSDVELLKEQIETMKEQQEVQDGAIADLGEAVSGLAEGSAV